VADLDSVTQRRDVSHDSRIGTYRHIQVVQYGLHKVIVDLGLRGLRHDWSKLEPPEREVFDKWSPRLAGLTFGSADYWAVLGEMDAGLRHHYQHNDHHPEHHASISQMSLMQLQEMLVDWWAAGQRHADGGDIMRSIAINQERYGLSAELRGILEATAIQLELTKR
jgi:hypothetical protein